MRATPTKPAQRYPVHLLVFAVVFLVLVAAGRLILNRIEDSQPQAPDPAPAPLEASDKTYEERLRNILANDPTNAEVYAQLGFALMSQVRLTNDPQLYVQAEQAFNEAIKNDPKQLDALVGQGQLALSRHEFVHALEIADQVEAVNPLRIEIWAIRTDANVELGRYDDAIAAANKLGSVKPGVAAYTRISYLRELEGNTDGAIEMMAQAVHTSLPGSEEMLWTQVQLGHLYFNAGRYDEAEQVYRVVEQYKPDYLYYLGAIARLKMARGDLQGAIADYETLTQRIPLPEYVIALGELYEATGQQDKAQQQYGLVEVMQQLNEAAGMNVDMELAVFFANHGDPAKAAELAQTAYQNRGSIYGADALAWALYKSGDTQGAQAYIDEAMRLGTQDATLYYHAGMIAIANGDAASGKALLQQALDINPAFDVLYAKVAQDEIAK